MRSLREIQIDIEAAKRRQAAAYSKLNALQDELARTRNATVQVPRRAVELLKEFHGRFNGTKFAETEARYRDGRKQLRLTDYGFAEHYDLYCALNDALRG